MKRKNIEIKARCASFDPIRRILQQEGADFRGIDEQTDTYFESKRGMLKLREATLPYERGLMHYQRKQQKSTTLSDITIYLATDDAILKEVLTKSLQTVGTVKKRRELYTIDNVKFHLDTVMRLGTFIEIEAQDTHGLIDSRTLLRQCTFYMKMLGIQEQDLLQESYKDLSKKRNVSY